MRTVLLVATASMVLACSSRDDAAPPDGADAGVTSATLTYHEHVESIVQDKCQSCHRAGGIAPFALSSYADAKKYAPLLAEKMSDRSMPPWGAFETDECKPRHKLAGDLGVAQADIDTVVKWVEQGAVEGDPSKAPAPKTFTDNKLEGVTHSATIATHTVAPANRDEHICFPVDPQLLEDTWMEGFSVTPGNTKVVHHVLVYGDPNHEGAAKAGSNGFYPCFGGPGVSNTMVIGGWVPGMEPTVYPAGVGMRLPKGLGLVVQMHYHPAANPETDATKVELRAAKSAPSWQADVRLIGNASRAPVLLAGPNNPASGAAFLIPAGAKGHTETMEFTIPAALPEGIRIAGITSHMHWVGKDLKFDIVRAKPTATDPANECLLQTPNYDFNWQRGYRYDAAIEQLPSVGPGDKLRLRCTYDNSTDNKYVVQALTENKLSSPVDVRLGEDTLDEMCLGAFTFYTKIN